MASAVEFREGADLSKARIRGNVRAQVCKVGTCLPPTDYAFDAEQVKTDAASASIVEYTHPNTHATIRGYLEPRVATPGATVNLVLTADAAPGWHIYELASRDAGALGNKPTVIGLANTSGFDIKALPPARKPSRGRSSYPACRRSAITRGK